MAEPDPSPADDELSAATTLKMPSAPAPPLIIPFSLGTSPTPGSRSSLSPTGSSSSPSVAGASVSLNATSRIPKPPKQLPKRVCIVGGGFAGALIAKTLDQANKNLDITLVDSKDFFENSSAVFQVLANPEQTPPTILQVPHLSYLARTAFVHGEVREVTDKNLVVRLQDSLVNKGDSFVVLPYDFLVLATGCSNCQLTKEPNISSAFKADWLLEEAKKTENSPDILIIGGSATGVELAANMAAKGAKVTLVELALEGPMPRYPPQVRSYVLQSLRTAGVCMLNGHKVTDLSQKPDGRYVAVTHRRAVVEAQFVYLCNGPTPNTDFLKVKFAGSMTPEGRIKVNEHLQVQGFANVFAAGDITDIVEEKLATAAMHHAKVVAKNILAIVEEGISAAKKKSYKPNKEFPYMVLSLGPNDAVSWEGDEVILTGKKAATTKRKMDLVAGKLFPKVERLQPPNTIFPASPASPLIAPGVSPGQIGEIKDAVLILRPGSSHLTTKIAEILIKEGHRVILTNIETHRNSISVQFSSCSGLVVTQIPTEAELLPLLSCCKCAYLPLEPSSTTDSNSYAHHISSLVTVAQKAMVRNLVITCPEVSSHGSPIGDPLYPIYASLAFIHDSKIPVSILFHQPEFRNPLFMGSLESLQLHRTLLLPIPSDGVLWMDTLDIAEACSKLIKGSVPSIGMDYHLTGPETLTPGLATSILSEIIGEEVIFSATSLKTAKQRLILRGHCELEVGCVIESLTTEVKQPTGDLFVLTGKIPRSFAVWAETKRAVLLAGGERKSVDFDSLLSDPEALKQAITSAIENGSAVHKEIDPSDLTLVESIDDGAVGEVFKGLYKNAVVAIKRYRRSDSVADKIFKHELTFISLLRHPNLVTCIGACTLTDPRIMVFEYVANGSLEKLLAEYEPINEPLPLGLQIKMAKDIARAMSFLNSLGIFHGDLKPRNLLVTRSFQLKLTDFDTCRFLQSKMAPTNKGTTLYMAPERLRGEPFSDKADVYSFAISMWHIVTRQIPFPELSFSDEVVDAVLAGKRPQVLQMSHPMRAVLIACWDEKPSKRPSFAEIAQTLDNLTEAPMMEAKASGGSLLTRLRRFTKSSL